MAYCTSTDVKLYLGINSTNTTDDTLITALIGRAQAAIEMHTHRKFEHSTTAATRRFTVGRDTDGDTLWLDEDLAAITTVTTNADASTATTISSTEYITEPRNKAPYYAIKIKASANKDWTYTTDPEMGVTIAGKWAYSTAAPADIKHACVRLAAFYYRQKDAQVFDVTAIPDAGVIQTPVGVPSDVRLILDPYVKRI